MSIISKCLQASETFLLESWPIPSVSRSLIIFDFMLPLCSSNSKNILMAFKSGNQTGHSRTFYDQSQALNVWFGMIVLLENPLIMRFSLFTQNVTVFVKMDWYFNESKSLIQSRFPLPAEKHPHYKTGAPPCLTMEMVLFCSEICLFWTRHTGT